MANVLNKTTKQYIISVNTPDYESDDWIVNPNLSAVSGWPVKYWKIIGNTVQLMTQAERDAADAAELAAMRDALVNQLNNDEDILRAVALVILDEINLLRGQHSLPARTIDQVKTAVRNKLGQIAT